MSALYVGALAVSILGQVLLDRRWRLFFWKDRRRATGTMLVGLVFFLVWDLLGIHLGIFFKGGSRYVLGVDLARELPLEEVFFLTLLIYASMNLYGWFSSRARQGGAA